MKPWYFKRDCPFCTRSASSFCRNPLNFFHMLYGWNDDTMPTFNLFRVHLYCFSISGSFSSKISKCMKNSKWCQKRLKVDDVALNGAYWTQKKFGDAISLKKWSAGLCNRWVFVRNPDTSKEIVQFVDEVHPVFAVNLSTFWTCYVGETMIPWKVSTFSEFICSAFQFQCYLAQKNQYMHEK